MCLERKGYHLIICFTLIGENPTLPRFNRSTNSRAGFRYPATAGISLKVISQTRSTDHKKTLTVSGWGKTRTKFVAQTKWWWRNLSVNYWINQLVTFMKKSGLGIVLLCTAKSNYNISLIRYEDVKPKVFIPYLSCRHQLNWSQIPRILKWHPWCYPFLHFTHACWNLSKNNTSIKKNKWKKNIENLTTNSILTSWQLLEVPEWFPPQIFPISSNNLPLIRVLDRLLLGARYDYLTAATF